LITDNSLYYVRARWYDPQIHRFLSEDPIGLNGGINLYSFADNNPINNSDPSGMMIADARGVCTIMAAGCGARELEEWFDLNWGSGGSGSTGYTCYVGGDAGRFGSCMQGAANYLGAPISVGSNTFAPSKWWDQPFTNAKTVSFAFKERTLGNAPTYNFVAQPGQLVLTKMYGNNDPRISEDGGITLRFEVELASTSAPLRASESNPEGLPVYFIRGFAVVTIVSERSNAATTERLKTGHRG
jgi:hypothetical protein